jgi:hypothetical protein
MRAALPALLDSAGSNIVTISSVNAFLPDPDLVLFLASDRAGNITGSDHTIDGGLISTL